jgi:hypothetical protein
MSPAAKEVSLEKLFSQLGGLQTDAARRKLVARHKALVRSEVVKQLAELVVKKIRVNTREALSLADATLLIARNLRRKEDMALALRARANALYANGDNRAAVEHHEKACKLYEALGILRKRRERSAVPSSR